MQIRGTITLQAVTDSVARHGSMYRVKSPCYQATMLNDLLRVWKGPHRKLLDVGGGTGVMAQCMADMGFAEHVETVDVANRYCSSLSIKTHVYDGQNLTFESNSFDAATVNNVVHHVPRSARVPLLRELRRVISGPIYIKDHVAYGTSDRARLIVLDAVGNLPFGGMVRASYLSAHDWTALAEAAGYRIGATTGGSYRRGISAALFPNRLERTMRWEAA